MPSYQGTLRRRLVVTAYKLAERAGLVQPLANLYYGNIRKRRLLSLNSINAYEQSVSSQNGEDGILKELLFRVGVTERYFVEFGVGEGMECNTSLLGLCYGWSGLMIEAGQEEFAKASLRYACTKVSVINEFVSAENIVRIFESQRVPTEFEILSIDIDGNDYWLWKALAAYRPRIVVIEYNASIEPPRKWVMPYKADFKWEKGNYYGASLAALGELGNELGYALLGTDKRGVNAFFVRRDLLPRSRFPERTPTEAYHPPRYGLFGIYHSHQPAFADAPGYGSGWTGAKSNRASDATLPEAGALVSGEETRLRCKR